MGGVDVNLCRKCRGAWVPLPPAGPHSRNWRALKTPPNAMSQSCIACSGIMAERTLIGCRILVCDGCAKAWLNATAIEMLRRKPTRSAETEELLSALAAVADFALIVSAATGK